MTTTQVPQLTTTMQPATATKKARGGMATNPFAQRERLDKFDFASGECLSDCTRSTGDSPERRIALQQISWAAHSYLYFALGQIRSPVTHSMRATDSCSLPAPTILRAGIQIAPYRAGMSRSNPSTESASA